MQKPVVREAAAAAKNAAYKKTLQSAATRAIVENYKKIIERREGKRDAFSDARRGSRKRVRVRKMYRCRNDARKSYQKFKRLTEGYKPEASSCKDEHGNLVIDP